jgi:RNA polymerase primary sigma factor
MKQFKIQYSITNRDGTTVEKYFTEVSRQPLLKQNEEVDLARRIKQGDQAALDKLVKANLRFVVSVAKQYQYGSLPLNDLINEGNLGLIKAAKMFDETKGYKFISYAVWWIRQSIMQSLADHSRLVRIPINKVSDLSKIKNASSKMEQIFEREPTQEELADFLQVKVEDIKTVQTATIKPSSLDAPFGEEDGNSMVDIIANPDSPMADTAMDSKDSLSIELRRLLSTLTEREFDIISRFFGMGHEYSQPLEDIAEDLNLTRERVRQIKEGALKKLRSSESVKLLQPYLCA